MTEKLSFDISDSSGAAEDIAGLSFQIAAAQYLKQQRSTNFATLCLDEPFGHLDPHNRDALASYLTAMLISSGFDQAFVVAHDSGIMNMLPNRIEIESKDGTSIIRTVRLTRVNQRNSWERNLDRRDKGENLQLRRFCKSGGKP